MRSSRHLVIALSLIAGMLVAPAAASAAPASAPAQPVLHRPAADAGFALAAVPSGLGTALITAWTRSMNGSWQWSSEPGQGVHVKPCCATVRRLRQVTAWITAENQVILEY